MNFNSYLNLSDGISNPITDWLAAHEKDIIHTADYIFHHPELAYQENVILNVLCLPDVIADTVCIERMPGDSHVQTVKCTMTVHNDFP